MTKPIIPFTATIEVGDTKLTATPTDSGDTWLITMEDRVDGRTEYKMVESEGLAAQLVADFCQPSHPGPAFVKYFPFWS